MNLTEQSDLIINAFLDIDGRFLWKEAICCNAVEQIHYKVVESPVFEMFDYDENQHDFTLGHSWGTVQIIR